MLRCDPFNLFFHPLPSGHHALGVLYPAKRSFFSLFQQPQSINVRVLVVPAKSLLEYANHPIALFEVLRQGHLIPFVSRPPKHLLPLVPITSPRRLNKALLKSLAEHPGAMSLAQLTQSLFNAECTLFTSKSVSALSVLSVLFDLLPIRYRPELTFSSDFFISPKNSFRLSGFSRLQQQTIRLMKQWGVQVISLERGNRGSVETLDPWSRFVYQLLQTGNFDFLEQHWNLEHRATAVLPIEMEPIIWDNLHEIGVSMNKAMLSGTLPDTHILATDFPSYTLEELRCVAAVEQIIPMLNAPKPSSAKPVSNRRLAERFPLFQHELTELETYLVRGIFGEEAVQPKIRRMWLSLMPQLDEETKAIIQEEIISTIHAVLVSLECDSGQRLLRSSQLLELMVFFLCRETINPRTST